MGKMKVPRAMYSFRMSFWIVPVLTLGLFKLFLPKGDLRNRTILSLAWLGELWVRGNNLILRSGYQPPCFTQLPQ
mgnify:CR=1 FL=1